LFLQAPKEKVKRVTAARIVRHLFESIGRISMGQGNKKRNRVSHCI
jgi:hypothetical protein